MSFSVRIFFYSGIVPALQPRVTQLSTDSVFMLIEPYMSGQKQASNGANEVAFTAAPTGAKLARIEVDDGNTIRYEVRMGSNTRGAGTNSPALSGRDIIPVSDGAVFAFVDAASV
jgi:hypothetical protein